MRAVRLSSLLVAVNVGLLLLAVAGVAIAAVRLLRQSADAQALARVEQAALIARKEIESTSDATLTSAQLLGERPTLGRLLVDDPAGVAAFLTQFQQTSQLDGAAVVRGGALIAGSGTVPPPAALPGAGGPQQLLYAPGAGQPIQLIALEPVATLPEYTVLVLVQLDQSFAERLSAEIGLSVRIHDGSEAGSAPALDAAALQSGQVRSARLADVGSYVAVVPLRASSGATVGVVEAALPSAEVTASVARLVQTLLLLALAVLTIAAAANLVLGRQVGRPLAALARAAGRIGRGDLATPIAVERSAEIGPLAATLEDMRGRLLRLTDDLRRQQAEAETIVTGIVEGVFSVDRERRLRYLNPQAAALLGTTPEAAIGSFCGDVLQPRRVDGVLPCAEQCPILHARFGGGVRATEHLQLANGQRRTVVITSAPAVGQLQVQVLRDETDVEATRRMRDTILANISHEFRTPLSAQLASIELLMDQLPELSTEQIGELVRSQQRGALRLTQLIDNLLESARLESGRDSIRHQPVALDEVVEAALDLTHPLLHQRAQSVVVELPYPLPAVCGDSRRLTQVFVNLLANANKFAPPGSTITVGGAVDAASVTLWVQDEGPGLPAMPTETLFGRFERASQDEPEQSGVGLGLWLVKSIVERHGGHVTAQSTAEGTRIGVALPVDTTDETADR